MVTTSVRVKFLDVGRQRKSWEETMLLNESGELSASRLVKSIKAHGALMSSDIDFGEDGAIYVGGWRPVGRFEIESGT